MTRLAARERIGLGALGIAGVAAVFELIPRLGLVSPRYLPPTSAMLAALAREAVTAAFWRALLETIEGWALGLAIAVAAGAVAGVVIGSRRGLRAATASTVEFLRPIPSVALIPVAVLLYGAQLRSTLLLVVYASFWPVLLQVIHGVADVDPVARDTARSYRLPRWAMIRYLVLPTALPYLLTGVRLSAAVALILAITAELVIGAPGLGNEIGVAMASSAVPVMYALIFVVGLIGVAVNVGFRALERRVLAWHPAVRREAAA
ncbi:MAG TPA: ABC transporter permease [Kofleriaceae bacterium]|jgi:ABC-type nitrate/sulfonate/bicarbonate transport system permease component|nr:ABC transporter permease [Kofleriaceae bacterium]